MEILESVGVESIVQLIQAIVNLGISLISSTVNLVLFILGAWGLFTIAKRRNLPRPWLAWIPVGNSWILGSIADQYREQVTGQKTVRRKWLAGLDIGAWALTGLVTMLGFAFLVVMVFAALFLPNRALVTGVFAVIMLLLFAIVVLFMAISVAYTVFSCIAHYDLFRSCKPNLAVLFLVLAILFGNRINIAVMIFRNSDEGMPAEQHLPEWTE